MSLGEANSSSPEGPNSTPEHEREDVREVMDALQSSTTDLLLISLGDGRVILRTDYDSQTTGEWLIRLGESVLSGEDWQQDGDEE